MKMVRSAHAFGTSLVALLVFGACSQSAPPAASAPTVVTVTDAATPAETLEARFDATAAVGGGMNSSNTVVSDDLKTVFASVPQVDKLRLTANSSPPGAKSGEVTSVSVIAQDSGGLLKELDHTAKQSLAEALLTAAGAAWPNASVSLLVSDPAGAGGQIIGSRGAGGPNTIIVT
jgi:hypothetical protein